MLIEEEEEALRCGLHFALSFASVWFWFGVWYLVVWYLVVSLVLLGYFTFIKSNKPELSKKCCTAS